MVGLVALVERLLGPSFPSIPSNLYTITASPSIPSNLSTIIMAPGVVSSGFLSWSRTGCSTCNGQGYFPAEKWPESGTDASGKRHASAGRVAEEEEGGGGGGLDYVRGGGGAMGSSKGKAAKAARRPRPY